MLDTLQATVCVVVTFLVSPSVKPVAAFLCHAPSAFSALIQAVTESDRHFSFYASVSPVSSLFKYGGFCQMEIYVFHHNGSLIEHLKCLPSP